MQDVMDHEAGRRLVRAVLSIIVLLHLKRSYTTRTVSLNDAYLHVQFYGTFNLSTVNSVSTEYQPHSSLRLYFWEANFKR